MTNDSLDEKPLNKAKENEYQTVVYFHECPYCGDTCDDYETSVVGEVLECVCGKKYEVEK